MNLCITPRSLEEFNQYYQFRWALLRQPWQQPKGSEKDGLEAQSIHKMIVNELGEVIAVGRLHKVSQFEAQIRYMAVANNQQGKGLGRQIINALEQEAQRQGVVTISLNSRENATDFYQALGYKIVEKTHVLYNEIQHFLMDKQLKAPELTNDRKCADELQKVWHSTIPLSKAMNIEIAHYDNKSIVTHCDLLFNKNLHNTMFAGSIYTLATLTGWGWVYLKLKELQLTGHIVLADANIRYTAPLAGATISQTDESKVTGNLDVLFKSKKARMNITVEVLCGDNVGATFEGKYVVVPE